MATRNGVWFLAVPVAFVIIALGLSLESLPPSEPTNLPRHIGRSSALAPFLRFARSGPTHADPAVNLKIAAINAGPLVPITVSTSLPDARTFCVDVDLNHDGRFEGVGELAYATGRFDEAGIGELRLHGLIDGRYRARVRVDGIHGETVSAIQKFELSAPRNSHLPVSFEANRGQTDSSVLFVGRAKNQMVFVTRGETVLVTTTRRAELRKEPVDPLVANPTPNTVQFATRFRLAGANSWAQPTGQKMLPGKANYFIGNDPDQWRTDIDTFAELTTDAYPGIRMIHRSSQGRLAYDFRVAPGANPADIALDFSDAARLSLNDDGDLLVHYPGGDTIRHSAPVMYQEQRGSKQAVKGDWVLKDGKQAAFAVAAYDRGRELVIDPLVFSTYLGSNGTDAGLGIAIDGAGNTYVSGSSASINFPTTPGAFQPVKGAGQNVVVVKMNAAGTAIIYSTFLGANGNDFGNAIAVDAAGNAYVAGRAASGAFPTTPGAFQTANKGLGEAFVTKLNPTGSALLYSTFVGGSAADAANGIAIDAAGNAYITGDTASNDFPTTPGVLQPAFSGGPPDAFIAKLDPAGANLVYSTYLGGSSGGSFDTGRGIAVDAAGNAYVTGESSSSDFQTTPGAFQVALAGGLDAFVVKMNPTGSAVVYSTFIGGAGNDQGNGIAIDAGGNVYIAGATASNDFPTTAGAFQTVQPGGSDAFVTKLNPAGNALLYSTYLGAGGGDIANAIAIDGAGNAYVAGNTSAPGFPTVNPIQATMAGPGFDAFATVVNPTGSALVFSTYLGGTANDVANGLAIDASGAIYLTGQTQSPDFPTLTPVQAANGGSQDLFIAKLTPGVGPPPPPPGPGSLYAITYAGQQLITIDTATGVGTLVGPLSTAMNATGVAFRGNKLYAWDEIAFRIRELDPTTGSTLSTIDIGSAAFGEGDIAFRSDGIGFLVATNPVGSFVRFDITVPNSTAIGPIAPKMDGLAFNAADVLYGLSEGGGALYTIDTTTGATTLVGNTGIVGYSPNTLAGLAFDSSGNLYASLCDWLPSPPNGPSALFKINVATGTATLVGNVGFNGVSGISFMPAAVVPPPPPPAGAGGISEGSYAGSKGLANGNGGEGTFGFGRHMVQQPRLKGPYRDPAGTFRVFNVAHQQRGPAAEADSGLGIVGWSLMLLAVFVPAAVVYGRRRPG